MKHLGHGLFSHVYDWNSHAVAKFTRCEASAFWLAKLLRARRVSRFFPSVLFTPDKALFLVERLYATPEQVQAARQARRARSVYVGQKRDYASLRLDMSRVRPVDRACFSTLGNINQPENLALYCDIPGAQAPLAQLCLWAQAYDRTHSTVMRVDLHADNVLLDMFGHLVFSDPVVTRNRGDFDEYVTPWACLYTRVEQGAGGKLTLWPSALPLRTAAARKAAEHFERAGLATIVPVGQALWTRLARARPRTTARVSSSLRQASSELCAQHAFALERFRTAGD